MTTRFITAVLLLTIAIFNTHANEPLVDAFGSLPDVKQMKVSPIGNQLAYLQQSKDSYALVVQDLNNQSTKPIVFATNDGQIRRLRWVNDNHILFSVTVPYFHKPAQMWHTLFRSGILNATTGKAIFPFDSPRYLYNIEGMRVEHMLPNDSNHILVSNFYSSGFNAPRSEGLFKLNVVTGDTDLIRSAFKPDGNGVSWIVIDSGDFIGYQTYDDNNQNWQTFWRQSDGNGFDEVDLNKELPFDMPLVLGVKDELAYIHSRDENGMKGLYSVPMNALQSKPTKVLAFEGFDLDNSYYQDHHTGAFIGATVIRDTLEQHFIFDKEMATIYASLQATFGETQIEILSYSKDRNTITFHVSGNEFAPAYYLYDRKGQQISALGSEYPNIQPMHAGTTMPFDIQASDELTIPGYLSLPKKLDTLPELLVIPHGGPSNRDDAAFFWLRDFFVANGFAVYQPNFRGSTGYGSQFQNAGYGQWGRRMQQDVYEGTRAVMASGKVAAKKPCVLGHSYGGYVAMMAAVQGQEVFRCAVSSAGISNIKQKITVDGIVYSRNDGWNEDDFAQQFYEGEITKSTLASISPHLLADENTLPLLMFHGKRDTRVRYKQSERMYARLQNIGKKNMFLLPAPGADHWFTQTETRKVLLSDALYFIQTN